jgi:Ca2+-binding EF-hand superfamily protein
MNAFELLDKDGDGFIDEEELAGIMGYQNDVD